MGGQALRQDVDLKVLLIYYTEQETFEKGTGRNSCPNPISQITIVQAESDNNEIMPVVTRVMYLPHHLDLRLLLKFKYQNPIFLTSL